MSQLILGAFGKGPIAFALQFSLFGMSATALLSHPARASLQLQIGRPTVHMPRLTSHNRLM